MPSDPAAPAAGAGTHELAELFADLGHRLLVGPRNLYDVLELLTHRACEVVAGAECAGVTRALRTGGFETVAATSEVTLAVDKIQYELGAGPCIDAITGAGSGIFRTGHLAEETRWPALGRRARSETGVQSMIAVRFFLEDNDLMAALTLYSTQPDAFDAADQTVATLLATHGALAVAAARRQDQVDNLNRALQSNRRIGVAIGILMAGSKFTEDEAFDLLRVASQHGHRKLVDIADGVARTGALELPTLTR